MYASAYFGRSNPSPYWPRTGQLPPDDLLAAIKAHWLKSPLTTQIIGGIFTDQAGDRSTIPYANVQEIGARLELKTSTSSIHDTRLRFTVYAHDLDTAGAYGNLIEDAFKAQALTWDRGTASPLVRHDRKQRKDKGRGQGTAKVWHMELEFQTRVRRS